MGFPCGRGASSGHGSGRSVHLPRVPWDGRSRGTPCLRLFSDPRVFPEHALLIMEKRLREQQT